MFEIIVGTIIGLFISYFIIRGAVKDAISETMGVHLKIQSAYLEFMAKKEGMEQWQIDKVLLTEKQYNKKYQEKKS